MEINEYNGWKNRENLMDAKDTVIAVLMAVALVVAYIVVGNLELM